MTQALLEVEQKNDGINQILQHRVGYGAGQNRLIHSLYVLLFAEGCETIVLGLLLPKLGSEWNLDKFSKSLLITIVYVGVSLGSYIETFSDKYGRYNFLLADAIITSIFGLLSCICTSFQFFLIVRFFYGIGIGIALPLTATYITQTVPDRQRGTVLSISRVYWSMGCLTTCILGWILLVNNHWRILLFVLCFPSFYATYDVIVNGRQSLRYLWAKGQLSQFKQVLDIVTTLNKVPNIPKQQLELLMSQQGAQNLTQQVNQKTTFMRLFQQKYCKQTLILCFAWITMCFIYYAVMLMLPSILSRNQSFSDSFQYIFIILVSLVQVCSFYSAKIAMDHPSFGRKKSIYYGSALIFVCSIFLIVFGQSQRVILLMMFVGIKVFVTICFMILYPYSAEIYQTLLRSQAMGVFSVCGRVATTFIGIIGVSALQWMGGKGLYYIFVFLTFFSSILVYKMPYCTLGRRLDS